MNTANYTMYPSRNIAVLGDLYASIGISPTTSKEAINKILWKLSENISLKSVYPKKTSNTIKKLKELIKRYLCRPQPTFLLFLIP